MMWDFFYFGKEYSKLMHRIFKIGLIGRDFHFQNFSSQKPALINIVDKYLVQINI